jgi:hypothetical protein
LNGTHQFLFYFDDDDLLDDTLNTESLIVAGKDVALEIQTKLNTASCVATRMHDRSIHPPKIYDFHVNRDDCKQITTEYVKNTTESRRLGLT